MFDINTIHANIAQAAQQAAERAQAAGDLSALWRALGDVGDCPDLVERIERARVLHWGGAIPTTEPPDARIECPGCPALPVVGVDGSQVYHDERRPVVWAYVQALAHRVGQLGSGLESRFYFEDDLLDDNGANLLPASWIDLERTVLEMQAASGAVRQWTDALVLLDGGLLPFAEGHGAKVQQRLTDYRYALCECRGSLVAAVVSGPQSRLAISLIRLAQADDNNELTANRRGIKDIHLMRHGLSGVGERSALFKHGSPRNDLFDERQAAIFFFFLRVSPREVARVEIPQWVADDPALVRFVHASVFRDSQAIGYSYALAQAHAQVKVPMELTQTLRDQADRMYFERCGRLEIPSGKQQFKDA